MSQTSQETDTASPSFFEQCFGTVQWQKPAWLAQRKATSLMILFIVFAVIGVFVALKYGFSTVTPAYTQVNIHAINVTPDKKNAQPDNLIISFFEPQLPSISPSASDSTISSIEEPSYRRENTYQRDPLAKDVANINFNNSPVTNDKIRIEPAIEGVWRFEGSNQLVFTPKADWPADTTYAVHFDMSVFHEQANIHIQPYMFTTPSFSATLTDTHFYQDPQNTRVKKVVSTAAFSHPVDQASFKQHVAMHYLVGQAVENTSVANNSSDKQASNTHKRQAKGEPIDYTVTFSASGRKAYIHSKVLQLPEQTVFAQVALGKKIRAQQGKATLAESVFKNVLIPDLYSFFNVKNARINIVRDEKNNPQQVVHLSFTDAVNKQALIDKTTLYLLPKGIRNNRHFANNTDPKILNKLVAIPFNVIDNPQDSAKNYALAIDTQPNRQVYIQIEQGLTSINGYVQPREYTSNKRVPSYPKELEFVGEGALLAPSASQKISLKARGIEAIKFKVSRLKESQLHHFISQTHGDISQPAFNSWQFDIRNLAAVSEKLVTLNNSSAKHAQYTTLDLSQFLNNQLTGIFYIEAIAWRKSSDSRDGIRAVKRLVVVSDLGVMVKNNQALSRDIFVQSISTGQPVAGANVQLLGINGRPILNGITSAKGHVHFASVKGFKNEKKPAVYLVRKNNDFSFIPFERYARQINISRFDIGGQTRPSNNQNPLKVHVFSDRGIYRPSETIRLGFVAKQADFSSLQHHSLEVFIKDPQHNTVDTQRITLSKNGLHDISYTLPASAKTGNYTINVYGLSNSTQSKRFITTHTIDVAMFQPDTLKLSAELLPKSSAFIPSEGWFTSDTLIAKATLNNLFGSPAQNRKIKANAVFNPAPFSFKAYPDFLFYTLNKNIKPHKPTLTTQTSDENGQAQFIIPTDGLANSTYSLQTFIEGYEQSGGRSVSAQLSTRVSPYKTLFGYKPSADLGFIYKDSPRSLTIAAINSAVKLTQIDGLTLSIHQLQPVSTLVKLPNGTYQYQSIEKRTPILSNALSISTALYPYVLDTRRAGKFELTITDSQDRVRLMVPYTVVGEGNLAGKIDQKAELSIQLDKTDYKAGDTINLNIITPYKGAGLITIETDKVEHFKWFKTDQTSTLQSIAIPQHLEGGGYINVAFVRDMQSKDIYTSPLSYAVKYFTLDKTKRRVDISLNAPKIVRPGQPFEVTYSASTSSDIIIYGVNEGILQVANYQLPNPLNYFISKQALSVKTLQMLDLVLPDFNIVKALSAAGGGVMAMRSKMMDAALAQSLNPFARTFDQPAVFWSGVIQAQPNSQTTTFTVPETFSGSMRVMAVAASEQAIGATQTQTTVRGPFVIAPNVVTHVAPSDEFDITVGVANLLEKSDQHTIHLTATPSEHLTIISGQEQTQIIKPNSEGAFTFRVKATEHVGKASIRFDVSNKNIAQAKTESATRTTTLSVRPAMHYQTTLQSGFSSKNTTLTLKRVLNSRLSEQTISASASPLVLTRGLNTYLKNFRHQCTEQITSKAFAELAFALPTHSSINKSALSKENLTNLNKIISTIQSRQQNDGGFSLWQWQNHTHIYPTLHAGLLFIEAQTLDLTIDARVIERLKGFLQNYVQSQAGASSIDNENDIKNTDTLRQRAMAIYLLTRFGNITTNYLVDLEQTLAQPAYNKLKNDITYSYIAASFALLKKQILADDYITRYALSENPYAVHSDFHSAVIHDAQHIYLHAKHFTQNVNSKQVKQLASHINKGKYNTLSAAYTLLAFSAVGGQQQYKNQLITFLANKLPLDLLNNPRFLSSDVPLSYRAVEIQSDSPFYYMATQSGFDNTLPKQKIAQGLDIFKGLTNKNNQKVDNTTPINVGDILTVTLRLRATDVPLLTNIAIIDLLPAGFEVQRDTLPKSIRFEQGFYANAREDRVVFYGNASKTTQDITYKIKATTAGQFIMPPVYGESMYDKSVRASTLPNTITVKAQ